MDRRNFVIGSAATAATLASHPAFAQEAYPSHAITLINPFPPGGAADVVGRPFAAVLEPIVKQPVVIDTKAGAAGAVGAQVAANAKPDGYTLLIHITSISGFAEVDKLFGRQPKFTRADFIPIARFVADPCVLLVNDKQPYKTLKDLTEDAKKRPDEIIFSSSGLYGALHIPTALYLKAAADSRCGTCRPTAAGRRSPRFSATMHRCWCLRSRPPRPDQGRQSESARLVRRQALEGAARCPDHEGARLQHRILSLGRPVRAQRHAGERRRLSAQRGQQGRAYRAVQDRDDQSRPGARLSGSAGIRQVLGRRRRAHRRCRSAKSAACRDSGTTTANPGMPRIALGRARGLQLSISAPASTGVNSSCQALTEEHMDRRSFVIGTAASAAALAARPAFAQETFPSHAITIINAFPPGGANDIVTRPLASALEPIVKQPVVIETKAGAAGQVGAQVAASAKPDGYTLLSHNNGISGYAEVDKLFGRMPKTTRADFIPIARLTADPVCCWSMTSSPTRHSKEFIDDAKKRPDAIIYSSGGLYGATHLPVAMLETAVGGLKLRHLPTNGGGPAITALLGNNAQASMQSISATLAHVKSGKLRPLASFGGTAFEGAARRADNEGTRLQRRILFVGRSVRAERHAGQYRINSERCRRQSRDDRPVQDADRQSRTGSRLSQCGGLRQILGSRRQAGRRGGEVDRQGRASV